jgi:alginate O-acetyltransferase complex protein AlgJ
MALTGSAIPTLDIQPAAQPAKGFSFRATLGRTLALAFAVVLFAPLIGAWRHWDSGGESTENRRLAQLPEFSLNYGNLALASDQLLDFYRDHFGFRNTLIRAAAIARLRTLHEDVDGRALIGKDGWLFYRPDGDLNLVAFRGISPFSRDQLDAWQQLLERRNAILAARKIPFLVVIVPDKQTIYSEFLPDAAAILVHRSRLDEVIDRLHRTDSTVHLLDLRPALFAAKDSAQVYYKTDSHWNDLGAYAAYRAIVDAANNLLAGQRIVPHSPGDFIERSNIFTRGDLSRMIHRSGQYPDTSFTLTPRVPFAVPPVALKPGETAETEVNDPARPQLACFHDSFGDSLIPMLGPHFRRALWVNCEEMDPAQIDQEKPDIVIDEFVERDFYRGPTTDPTSQKFMPPRGLPGS